MRPITSTINYRLAMLCRRHRNIAAVMLSPHDLYPGQDLILVQLWQEDGVTQSRLAERVGVDVSTLTKAVQRLERHGFIQRRQDTEDARVVRICLSEQGRALEPILTAEWNQLEARTLADLSDDERAIMERLIQRVEANLS